MNEENGNRSLSTDSVNGPSLLNTSLAGSARSLFSSPFASSTLAVSISFLLIFYFRFVTSPDAEPCADAFYHVAISQQGATCYAARTFPKMSMSAWKDSFYDKELAFHFAIEKICGLQRLLGFDTSPPFHMLTSVFILFFLISFAYCLARFSVKSSLFWFLLMLSTSPYFLTRMTMLRPHLLGMGLMLLSTALISQVNSWRRLYLPLFCAFLYVYSYSQPHFILLPAIAFALVKFRKDPGLAFLIPSSAALGLFFGLLLHPQFPATFTVWKIQSIDVPLKMLGSNVPVFLGEEMLRPSSQFYLENLGVFLLFAFNSMLLLAGIRRFRGIQCSESALALYLISAVASFGLIFSYRPIEYACPLSVISCAVLTSEFSKAKIPFLQNFLARPAFLRLAKFSLCIIALLFLSYASSHTQRRKYLPFNELSDWWRDRGFPENTRIANLLWSDFPQLFYSLPECQYLFGLDPMFGYWSDPGKVSKIELFRTGQIRLSPDELSSITGARFAFVSFYCPPLAKDMFDSGFRLVYQGKDGWLFDLDPSENPTR